MEKWNNKWVRAAVPALLIHCSIGTVYCWSLFKNAIAEQIGSSVTTVEWAFSLAIFCLGMSAAFAGKLVERDIRKASFFSAICFALGMAGTGFFIDGSERFGSTVSLIGIFICYGCIMGVGLGIGYLTPVKTLMLWFSKEQGLATGISIMGFGLAKVIASPLMEMLQRNYGISAMFYILAAVYLGMMLLGHFLLQKPAGHIEKETGTGFPFKKLLQDKMFIGIWLMFYINITCGLALISFEKSILVTAGVSTLTVGLISSFTAAANALGRIGFSTLSDSLKDRNTIYKMIFALSMLFCFLSFLTGAVSKGLIGLVVALLLVVNAGYGGGFSTLPALLSSRFGMDSISKIHGMALSAWAMAGISGNQMSSLLYKITGRYETVIIVILILYLTAMIISCLLVSAPRWQSGFSERQESEMARIKLTAVQSRSQGVRP